MESIRPVNIETKIYTIRRLRIMLDVDLAKLYGVTTFNLNKAVARNQERFPSDFMFRLTAEEAEPLKFQIGMSKVSGRGGRRSLPFAFTQEGISMLSSVLRSDQAVLVNVHIMRAFVKLREHFISYKDITIKLDTLEKKYDRQFAAVFDAIRNLMSERSSPRKRIAGLGRKDD